MTFDWTQDDKEYGDKMGEGYHYVRAERVVFGKKDGTPFTTQYGDPQIMVVFSNAAGEEAIEMFTLNEKAAWRLRSFLIRAGADAERMNRDGITPRHFTDETFAEKQIVGREVWVYVKPRGKYADIEFVNEGDVPAEQVKKRRGGGFRPASVQQTADEPQHVAVADEDVPF